MRNAQNILMCKSDESKKIPTEDVEEGMINKSELEVECTETARSPPHSVLCRVLHAIVF